MSKTERRVLGCLLVAIVGLGTFAGASWFLGYEASSPTGYVITSEGVIYGDNLSMDNIDTTNSSFEKLESIEIQNPDGEYNLTVDIETINIDTDAGDSCDISGDVDVDVEYDYGGISDGETITIRSGTSYLTVETSAKLRSCPQNVTTMVVLAE